MCLGVGLTDLLAEPPGPKDLSRSGCEKLAISHERGGNRHQSRVSADAAVAKARAGFPARSNLSAAETLRPQEVEFRTAEWPSRTITKANANLTLLAAAVQCPAVPALYAAAKHSYRGCPIRQAPDSRRQLGSTRRVSFFARRGVSKRVLPAAKAV